MANIDVSEVVLDPDFIDDVVLIRRSSSVGDDGRNVLAETRTPIMAAVQDVDPETMQHVPEGVRLIDGKTVFYAGTLYAQSPGGYSDIIELADGRRFEVVAVPEDFTNHGQGFVKVVCSLETVSA